MNETQEIIARNLKASISEEKQAIVDYELRASVAQRKGFPEVEKLYNHIAAEEQHHREELQEMLNRLEGK